MGIGIEGGLELPLDVRGTAFQQRVWRALRDIPAGSTLSYTELAERIGAPKSVRAVAGACAANVLAVAIPCHRVLRHDGAAVPNLYAAGEAIGGAATSGNAYTNGSVLTPALAFGRLAGRRAMTR